MGTSDDDVVSAAMTAARWRLRLYIVFFHAFFLVHIVPTQHSARTRSWMGEIERCQKISLCFSVKGWSRLKPSFVGRIQGRGRTSLHLSLKTQEMIQVSRTVVARSGSSEHVTKTKASALNWAREGPNPTKIGESRPKPWSKVWDFIGSEKNLNFQKNSIQIGIRVSALVVGHSNPIWIYFEVGNKNCQSIIQQTSLTFEIVFFVIEKRSSLFGFSLGIESHLGATEAAEEVSPVLVPPLVAAAATDATCPAGARERERETIPVQKDQ